MTQANPRRWLALPVLLLGAFLPVLDFNVVNLALPAIQKSLGASASDLQFVISAYAASYAVLLITGGRLGDWLGRKRMFMLGIAGFTLASILCGMAWSPAVLIMGRILQGMTATAMAPQVLASIRVLFPAEEQSKALALYGATFGLANIVGQILGGVLVSFHPFGLGWQTIFLVNVPIGLAAWVGSTLFLTDTRSEHPQKLDIGGIVLLSMTLGLLVYPLVEGRATGWPLWMRLMLALCPVALFAFTQFEKRLSARRGSPLVDLAIFREPGFATGVAMALVFYMLSSFYLTFSIYLQSGLHLTPLAAGLRTLPFAVGYFGASLISARIVDRLGVRALTLGYLIQVIGFGAVILSVLEGMPESMETALCVAGIGYGVVMPSVIKAVIGGVDPRHAGLASGIAITTFQIGAALGVAVIGGIFFSVLEAGRDPDVFARAFAIALGCNVVLLISGAVLSLRLGGREQSRAVQT
jgi:EmrB/QacA subfamily drug resistance transporter